MAPSRNTREQTPGVHYVLKTPYDKPAPEGFETAYFATGCFWGPEKKFWDQPGVHTTAVGYQGGTVDNPSYDNICSGKSGHSESVKVVFDPKETNYVNLLKVFWECHDPTQGNRQGNDVGSQYRSEIFTTSDEQQTLAEASKQAYQKALQLVGRTNPITTKVTPAPTFWLAEEYHQQYLSKPGSRQYCSAQPTGARMPDPSQWLPKELLAKYTAAL
ncbi:Peptide methionine sulfoxide reductase MsrA 2 [Diplonema papillatum]|nr:Peptide methionine sulfoxide reductase MsrA 2 [Diplonema papillatum]